MAIVARAASRVAISFSAWPSRNLTFRESLRDIETCLRAFEPKLYHAGFRGQTSRAARWPMPTALTTGESTPTSLRC